MDWITDSIAIGNIEDAMDTEGLRAAGVTGVLCLNGFPHHAQRAGFAWVKAPLIDGPGNTVEEIQAAVRGLDELCRSHRVMVHCAEGLSRSALIVACYLAEQQSISLDAAIEQVTQHRPRAFVDRALLALLGHRWPPVGVSTPRTG